MEDCPFCSNTILAHSFHENEHFRAIYNIAPILPGHSLIISKSHRKSFLDLDPDEHHSLSNFIKETTLILLKHFKGSGFNFSLQDGYDAGQTVDHFHLHLIPRTGDDLSTPGDWYPMIEEAESQLLDSEDRKKLSPEQMQQIIQHLRLK